MNPVQTVLQTPVLTNEPADENSATTPVSRLVVVLQDVDQETVLASRVLELAQRRGLEILLIGIVPDSPTKSNAELRRKLVRVAAFIKDAAAHAAQSIRPVQIRMDSGPRWPDTVRLFLHPGDLLACGSDSTVGRLQRPLSDVLGEELRVPVYVFTDLGAAHAGPRNLLARLAAWIGSLMSIIAFCLVAAKIVLVTEGLAQSILLLGALAIEIAVIYLMNSMLAWV